MFMSGREAAELEVPHGKTRLTLEKVYKMSNNWPMDLALILQSLMNTLNNCRNLLETNDSDAMLKSKSK